MLFTTDKQTLDDLNIFGKHGGGGIYNLFNRTVTKGGAAVLEEMFQYPLGNHDDINRRSGKLSFFSGAGLQLPFTGAQLDAIESYLANTDERTRLSAEGSGMARRFGNLVAMDGDTAMIYKGIHALAELLQGIHRFMASLVLPHAHPYLADRDAIMRLLEEPGLTAVLTHTVNNKLPHHVLAGYDGLFRFRHCGTVQRLLNYCYELDVYMSVAAVARERAFTFAVALPREQHRLHIAGVYHPLVKHAVPNNIAIMPAGNILFLTGANMAGKSTFMKSLSVALFLAHMGFPVPAAQMEFSALDGLYTTINLPDNLGMGASHFYAEVLRVKKIAVELAQGRNLFIVFDELFRGTNVKDAYEATIAIVKAFARRRNSFFVISTHIIEAGAVLREACDNVRFVYLPTHMNGSQPVYTYKLVEGITADRHGMVIINNEGILDMLRSRLPKT